MFNIRGIVKNNVLLKKYTNFLNNRSKTTTTDNNNYQYLQQSKIPMLHFQPSLPRLPIPELSKTCERYLSALYPILNDTDYNNTKRIVKSFQSKDGIELQRMLKENDKLNKHTSYISEPWFDMYLKDRIPLPINYNPLLMMKHDVNNEYNDQLIRTTNIIISTLRFYRSLKDKCLEPEVFHMNPYKSDTERFKNVARLSPSFMSTYVAYTFKAFPLDMSQYQGLFAGTRIPELNKDKIYRSDNNPRHILILRNGNFYAVDVINESGFIESPSIILSRIKYILSDNNNNDMNKQSLGILTTENRNNWANLREYLINIGNKNSFDLIDNALFCLSLDNAKYDINNPVEMIQTFLYGDKSCNRWFDKSLSIIISNDGTAGINFEHSWGDGVAVLRLFNEIYKETTESPFVHPNTIAANDDNHNKSVRLIEFILDDKIKNGIDEAKQKHETIINSLDMNVLQYDGLGRKFCKKYSISPDSFMQLGFQLAFYKQYQKYVGTYESCSTAAFRHGRTETMRPCTKETKEFCDAIMINNKRPTNNELRTMISNCSKVHSNLTKEGAMGQGFDRHLYGLKHTAEINGLPQSDIFLDNSYQKINYNIISTSTLSSNGLLAGGFGPVVHDGYGIGYNIQDNLLGSIVTSYSGKRNGSEFVDCLKSSYEEIKSILELSQK